MKIVFMGTPKFSATILQALIDAGHEITAVITQPDKPKGRGKALSISEVKELALEKELPVYQPERIKNSDWVKKLKELPCDVFVVAAYGQILSQEILDIPRYGSINVHGSLLPKYRGASPIQRAIANGEKTTGVTVMQMDKGMDTGDIILEKEFDILDDDTEDSVYDKMAEYGSKALLKVLTDIENGSVTRTPQDETLATYAPPLKKEEGAIDFNKSAFNIDCLVRGFKNWPTAYTYIDGKLLKVFETRVIAELPSDVEFTNVPGSAVVTKNNLYAVTGEGFIELTEVCPEGKKRMKGADFARGAHLSTGDKFGRE